MKHLLYGAFAILLCLAWSCNDEGLSIPIPQPIDPDDTTVVEVTLTHMVIEEIEILEFPKLSPEGQYWDWSEGSLPDLYVSLQAFGNNLNFMSDTLYSGQDPSYTVMNYNNRCYVSTEDAVLLDGPAYLAIPVNFQGMLSLWDYDLNFCAFFCPPIPRNPEMQAFPLSPAEYINGTPYEIFLTNEDECRYILRLVVRWV